jgi:hypothetical protein
MTRGHRHAIVGQWPEVADRTELLSKAGKEIADPVGGPAELYRQCADQIEAALAERIAEIILTEFQVPWLRLQLNKQGAIRGARDVGVIIERGSRTS